MTRQRRVILEELAGMDCHPSAGQLFDRVRERLPKVSLGTVYRNLEVLSRRGLVNKLYAGGDRTRYDGRLEEHHHFRCLACGRIADLGYWPVNCPGSFWKKMRDHRVIGRRLEITGFCPGCREPSDQTSKPIGEGPKNEIGRACSPT